ncbi:MAG: phosphatidylglycerophosphatase A [Myxococcales bacterium]|nr:phosphatidylglycerophosphatase A [Myxococcales bacterium]
MTVSDRLAHALALWFGCGLVPYAPGTAGTLGAIPLYLLVRPHGLGVVLATAVLLTAVGIWAAGRVAAHSGTHDPQIVVIDEVAGVFVTWLAAPASAAGLVTGVVLFRIFDVCKPWPARRAERLAGGWGIVLDDLAAGAWGAALLLGARALGWL